MPFYFSQRCWRQEWLFYVWKEMFSVMAGKIEQMCESNAKQDEMEPRKKCKG